MKRFPAYRYQCDHCSKRGSSGGHMKHHESVCTMNPARQCGMCRIAGMTPKPVAESVAVLRASQELPGEDHLTDLQPLRDFVGNCPACILAAIRQSKIGEEVVSEETYECFGQKVEYKHYRQVAFDYMKEAKAWLDDCHADEDQPQMY